MEKDRISLDDGIDTQQVETEANLAIQPWNKFDDWTVKVKIKVKFPD
jgi:hypothetical protein